MDERRDTPGGTAGQPDDEAFERLRAADPAAGLPAPDAAALRAEVARRASAPDAGGTPEVRGTASAASGAVPTAPEEPHDPASEGGRVVPLRRRPARWLPAVAAATVGALLVGGVSFAAGRATGGDTTAAPVSLGGGQAGVQTEAKVAAGAAADLRIAPGFGGRTVFTSAGLGDEAGSARAWALDAASVFSAETAGRVAAALGVAGDPVQQWGAWTVGPQDGSGASVTLQPDGTAGVSYYDPARDPWTCTASSADEPGPGATAEPRVADPDAPDAGAADGGTATGTDPGADPAATGPTIDPGLLEPAPQVLPQPSCDPVAGTAPTGDAAVDRARSVLASLDQDADAFTYDAQTDDTRLTTVTATRVVDGQRTDLTWSLTLVGDGVQSLYGSLAPLVDLGEYPVVGADSAVERLADPRFGPSLGGVMPLARTDASGAVPEAATLSGGSASEDAPSDGPTVPPTARPGDPIPWPVERVTITGARLGLALTTGTDGSALLLPSYELADEDGSAWGVVALADGSLDFGN